jgi:DNA gyrase subunit B
LVEGDSAGGSAESGRDRMFQAILPLRGKPLNVEKARTEKVLANEEICSIISAVGVDIGNSEDTSRRRYGKIVMLTDADVDGQHIRTLLLTFFYRQMKKLVEDGYIFVARPPLYKVTHRKQVRYVQTQEEMSQELMNRGLDGTALEAHRPDAAEPSRVEGERLEKLVRLLDSVEEPIRILERRGMNLAAFLSRRTAAGLPTYRVLLAGNEHWFVDVAEKDAFLRAEKERLGIELVVADEWQNTPAPANGNGHTEPAGPRVSVQELHEVRGINRGIESLREFGFDGADLIPQPRVAGREPPPRFFVTNGESKPSLHHLRDLPSTVRRLGEKGLSIMRFKGLGEMDPEELWDTTLDPARRTLLKVQLDDAFKADEMFRTLMGEKVEPRRDFIQKHALEVKDIDYHGA